MRVTVRLSPECRCRERLRTRLTPLTKNCLALAFPPAARFLWTRELVQIYHGPEAYFGPELVLWVEPAAGIITRDQGGSSLLPQVRSARTSRQEFASVPRLRLSGAQLSR